jgi:hypothetical protein
MKGRPDMFMSTSGGYILSGIYVGMAVSSKVRETELVEVTRGEDEREETSLSIRIAMQQIVVQSLPRDDGPPCVRGHFDIVKVFLKTI